MRQAARETQGGDLGITGDGVNREALAKVKGAVRGCPAVSLLSNGL